VIAALIGQQLSLFEGGRPWCLCAWFGSDLAATNFGQIAMDRCGY
jgi:hypothetical protein